MKESNIKKTIVLALLLISFSIYSVPGKKDVENSVKKEIDNQIKNNNSIQYWNKLISTIFEKIYGLRNLKDIVMVLIVFLICLLVFAAMFFLFRNVSSVRYRSEIDTELESKNVSSLFDIRHLEDLIRERNYSEAVIYIHRCSVFHLIKKQVIFNSNMTNFTIYLKILDDVLKDSFRKISLISEKVLFDEYEAEYDDVILCQKLYMENFNHQL